MVVIYIEYFSDFKLGSYRLSDFGGVIINDDGWKVNLSPSAEYITEKTPLKDGEFFFGSRLNPRVISVKAYFEEEIEVEKFVAWLTNPTPQSFSFVDDNKEIDVVYDGFLDMECYDDNGFRGIVNISFIAHNPYYRVLKEKDIVIKPISAETYSIKNKGNVDSYPLIKITPIGKEKQEIKFQWNDVVNTLRNVDKEIYLDCESEDIYEVINDKKELVTDKYYQNDYWEFPYIKPFVKNILQVVKGNIEKIEIQANSKIK